MLRDYYANTNSLYFPSNVMKNLDIMYITQSMLKILKGPNTKDTYFLLTYKQTGPFKILYQHKMGSSKALLGVFITVIWNQKKKHGGPHLGNILCHAMESYISRPLMYYWLECCFAPILNCKQVWKMKHSY